MSTGTHALRPLTVDDLDAWVALLDDEPDHLWTPALVHEEIAGEGRFPVGAFFEGALVGAIAIQALESTGEVWILDVTVARAHRRRGIARALVDVALARGRGGEVSARMSVWLEVRATNTPARALYRAAGFTEVAVRKGYYPSSTSGGAEDAIVLRADPP